MKINSLADLKQEKLLLKAEADTHMAHMREDVEHIKKALSPLNLLKSAIPQSVKIANAIRVPMDLVSKVFDRKKDSHTPVSAEEEAKAAKRAQIKEMTLNVIETAASVVLSRYVRRKF